MRLPSTSLTSSRHHNLHLIELARSGGGGVRDGALVAIVRKCEGRQVRPRRQRTQCRAGLHGVDAVGQTRADYQVHLAGLTRCGRAAEQKPRIGISGHNTCGELKEIILPVEVGIDAGGGERIVEAKVLELPGIVNAIAVVAGQVVAVHVEHCEPERSGESAMISLNRGERVFINDGRGGEATGIDAGERSCHHAPRDRGRRQGIDTAVIHCFPSAQLPRLTFVDRGGRRGELQRGDLIELAEVAGLRGFTGRGDAGQAGCAARAAVIRVGGARGARTAGVSRVGGDGIVRRGAWPGVGRGSNHRSEQSDKESCFHGVLRFGLLCEPLFEATLGKGADGDPHGFAGAFAG